MTYKLEKLKEIPTLKTKIERYESKLKQITEEQDELISRKNQTET